MKTAILVFLAVAALACTEAERAKSFGGEMVINLPPCTKLFDVTWKESNLWYAVRPMLRGEKATSYQFLEDSSWGALEGKVTFFESCGTTGTPP